MFNPVAALLKWWRSRRYKHVESDVPAPAPHLLNYPYPRHPLPLAPLALVIISNLYDL